LKFGYSGGVRVGVNNLGKTLTGILGSNVGVEGQLSYVPLKPSQSGSSSGSQYNLRGDLVYQFLAEKKLVPFAVLGGGWSVSRGLASGNNQDATLDFGGGVKYFLAERVALRGDLRNIFSFHTGGRWQNVEYTAGVTYEFGGVVPPSPAVVAAVKASPEAKEADSQPQPPPALSLPSLDLRGKSPEARTAWWGETATAPAGKVLISGLNVEQNGLEIVASERIRDYRVLTLTQPSRLVIEIPNGVSGFTEKSVAVNRLGIATVSFENSPDLQRIILEGAQGRLIPYRIQETAKGLKVIVTNQ
jgi:hypothetical protein